VNYRNVPGVKYVAGLTFQSEYGVHEAGSEVKEAEQFPNLEVLVSNHFLWPYAPDEGYDYLPVHLFGSVERLEEVKAHLDGDPTPHSQHEKPVQLEQSEKEAEAQTEIYAKIMNPVQPKAEVVPEEQAPKRTPRKRAPRKTTKK